MSEAQIAQIITKTLDARRADRKDWPKLASVILGCLVALGGIYTMFLQPSTVAQAAQDTQEQIDRHGAQLHVRMEKRLDRMDVKLDRLLEK